MTSAKKTECRMNIIEYSSIFTLVSANSVYSCMQPVLYSRLVVAFKLSLHIQLSVVLLSKSGQVET